MERKRKLRSRIEKNKITHSEIRNVKSCTEKFAGFSTEVSSITERSNAEAFHNSTTNKIYINSDKR